jgi:RNA polymerase sigma-70 factor (ECF subfamily)
MLAVARRILRNEEEARDACQDAFLAVTRSMHRFGENSRLGTWIHAIVVNSCLMRLRTKRRRPEVLLSSWLLGRGPAGDPAENIPARQDDPAARMDARRELRRLARALATLPPGYREVLVLRFVLERSAKQTARILKTTPNAVQIRVHRARRALASTYGGMPRLPATPDSGRRLSPP